MTLLTRKSSPRETAKHAVGRGELFIYPGPYGGRSGGPGRKPAGAVSAQACRSFSGGTSLLQMVRKLSSWATVVTVQEMG